MNQLDPQDERTNIIPLHRRIHPTAVVHPKAELGAGVTVGPYAVIGEHVVIGDGTQIGPHVVIDGWTVLGRNNRIHTGAVVGSEPQDLKFRGEKTYLVIGDENEIREYATISRGTEVGGGETRIGNGNMIMSNAHIGHDVQMGNGCIVVHAAGLGGNVILEDRAYIGGLCGVHQFCKVGRMAMVGAHAMVTKDVPPFLLVSGNPARVHGVNVVGLRRNGLSQEARMEINRAFKLLYRSGYNVSQALQLMEQKLAGTPEIDHFLRFIRSAERGICR